MATALPSTCNTAIKNNIVNSKFNCTSNSDLNADELVELNLKSNNANSLNSKTINDQLTSLSKDKTMNTNGLNHLNKNMCLDKDLNKSIDKLNDKSILEKQPTALTSSLCQKKKSEYLNSSECVNDKNENNLNKKIKNGQYCETDLDNSLDNNLENGDKANDDEQICDNVDKINDLNNCYLIENCDNCTNDCGKDCKCSIKKICEDSCEEEKCKDEKIKHNNLNNKYCDLNDKQNQQQLKLKISNVDQRKESITEQMDTDNELEHKDEDKDDKNLTEDEQMEISQCEQFKSSKNKKANQQENNQNLVNSSYSSSLCSTPSDLTDLDLNYVDRNEQMDTNENQLESNKKSINLLLNSHENKEEEECSTDDKADSNRSDNEKSNKSDDLFTNSSSDKSSTNNSNAKIPDEVRFNIELSKYRK